MQYAPGILARLVDGAVDGETGRIDRERRGAELVAGRVDLDQAAGGDSSNIRP